MRQILTIVCCLIAAGCTGCIESQNFVALENRVASIEMENSRAQLKEKEAKLENELAQIKRLLAKSPIASPQGYAEIKYDIQTIKENIQRLEGRIDELNHRMQQSALKGDDDMQQQISHLGQKISKNEEKILKIEQYMGFEPTVSALETGASVDSNMAKDSDNQSKPDPSGEQAAYDAAKKLFDEGSRENARIQFENFINKFPDSKNSDNARFWIAETYYVDKWYEQAILEYQKVIDLYPDSNKLAAARLKQGYAFAELGEKANARIILKDLVAKHPKTNEAKYAREKLKHLQ